MERLANTRLQSSLVWGADPCEGLIPELDCSPLPVTGPVPSRWRAFVDARHLNRYYDRIVHYVRNPVETETRAGRRRVAVLGQAVFELDANGFVKAYLWGWENDEFGCYAQHPGTISIGNTPHAWTWLDRFRWGFLAELAQRQGRDQDELGEYAWWVFTRLRRRLARECDLRHMRELVSAALALDPLAVQVARRIRLDSDRAWYPTLREYNHAIAHLAAFRKLQKEAPNLVPLYAVHAYDLDTVQGVEPAQQLKRYLTEVHGLNQATWDLAHNARPRWMHLVGHFYDGPRSAATIDLLRLLQLAGFRRAPLRWYLWNLLQVFGHHRSRRSDYAAQWEPHARALRRLTALVEAADPAQLVEMRDNLYEVLIWMIEEDAEQTRGVSRAGWTWFMRRAAEWRAHQEKVAAALPGQWPAPFDAFRSREHTVKVLRNHHALLAEARSMSHCVDTYVERCAAGGHLVLSIRKEGRVRPVATAHLRLERGQWRIVNVAGRTNTVARPVATHLAAEACERINAVRWRPPQFAAKAAERDAARDRQINEAARAAFLDAPDDIIEQGEAA